MRYNISNIENTQKFLFFWGHQPSQDGSITKSCFSQWWLSSFEVEGVTYQTAEHWMMAQKAILFNDHSTLEKVINAKTPVLAKKMGRMVQNFDNEIWNAKRFEIVVEGNYHKFSQHTRLKEFLLQTNNNILVEASPVDAIWGIGMAADHKDANNPEKWRGLNLLGFALMEVRDRLMK